MGSEDGYGQEWTGVQTQGCICHDKNYPVLRKLPKGFRTIFVNQK